MRLMTQDEIKLVEDNHNLIYSLCIKNNISVEDYYGILALGLCKSAMKYTPERGKFSSFAWTCMMNEFRMCKRHEKVSISDYTSIDTVIFKDSAGNKLTIKDILVSTDSTEDCILSNIIIDDMLSMLSELDKKILRLRLKDLSQKEIDSILGITQSYVSRRIIAIGKRLKGE